MQESRASLSGICLTTTFLSSEEGCWGSLCSADLLLPSWLLRKVMWRLMWSKGFFKVLFKVCWLFCRGFWSCRIGKFDCSSAMTQNFAAGSHQRGHTGNWGLLCGCLAWVDLIPLWFSLQSMNKLLFCCLLKCVEVHVWWCLHQGTICGAWGNGCAQEMAMNLGAQAWHLGSMKLTLSSVGCDV